MKLKRRLKRDCEKKFLKNAGECEKMRKNEGKLKI